MDNLEDASEMSSQTLHAVDSKLQTQENEPGNIIAEGWLVVSNIFISHNIWDNPSHWLIFFNLVKPTNKKAFKLDRGGARLSFAV